MSPPLFGPHLKVILVSVTPSTPRSTNSIAPGCVSSKFVKNPSNQVRYLKRYKIQENLKISSSYSNLSVLIVKLSYDTHIQSHKCYKLLDHIFLFQFYSSFDNFDDQTTKITIIRDLSSHILESILKELKQHKGWWLGVCKKYLFASSELLGARKIYIC